MRKTFLYTGVMLAFAGAAFAGPRNNDDYDLYVIADEVTDNVIYVVMNADETVAIEVLGDEKAHWLKDSDAKKAIARSETLFGPDEDSSKKGFAFTVKDDDAKISFPLLFFKHIAIHANDDEGARVSITSKDGEGDVLVRADDDGAFITIIDASARAARNFIDDIDEAPASMRNKMKRELGLK